MLLSPLLVALTAALTASAHTVISYPGWRGNNLITDPSYPFGMQWMYPCGGMNTTTNRTYWPTTGGAIAFQPGWFQGHATAFAHINLGFGTDGPWGGPPNMSNIMVPIFQIVGPSRNPFPGTVCLPQVPLPPGAVVQPGDNATIQIVELALHGASLFSCVDITFAAPGDPRIGQVNGSNCYNSTDIGFADVYTITTVQPVTLATSDAARLSSRHLALSVVGRALGWAPALLVGLLLLL